MRSAWIVSTLTSVVFGLAMPSPAAGNEMVVTMDGAVLRADEITPGADVAWFSLSRERTGERTRVVRRHGLERDDDGDGMVSVILQDPAAPHSAWMAVDMQSGTWGVWWSSAGDDGGGDQDRSINGVIEIAFDQMVPLDGAPVAPVELAAGDLLVVIDPHSLATAVRQYVSTVG